MKTCFLILATLLSCRGADGQRISFGVKAGMPLSNTKRSEFIGNRFNGSGLWSLYTRPYTIGGAVKIAIPFGLSVEADALYKRTDTTQHGFFNPSFGTITRLAANAWEFPMLVKHRWKRGFEPFAGVGGSFRRIQGYDASTEAFAYGLNPPYSVRRYRIDEPLTQGGITAGVGLHLFSAGPVKIAPELRYTRWTSIRFLPTQNQVEFLVGVGF